MTDAKRDSNYVTTLIGVSSVDGKTPVTIYVDPVTHRVLTSAMGGSGVAGLDTQVQFNDGGAMAGNAGLTFVKATGILTATGFAGPLTGAASLNLLLSGGTMTGDILGAVSLGATGTRLTKVWTAALECTALPTINGGTLAAALNLSGTNTGDNAANSSSLGLHAKADTAGVADSATGASGSCSGNAATATKLAATKMINGVAFDGSANIVNAFAEGTMINGRILPSVSGGNLTVALKTLAGTDPSATDPVYVMIGGVVRTITAALLITMNAATGWMNLGSAELATKEADQFAYMGYNATDGVVFGSSRYPGANIYSDFSTTSTNEKYCRISTITNAAASDAYVNIGRFAATLSAGAGYTWSVPTFTASNLIQKPCYETRPFTWIPQLSASASMTYLSTSVDIATAQIVGNRLIFFLDAHGTTGGSADYYVRATLPFAMATGFTDAGELNDGGDKLAVVGAASSTLSFARYDGNVWGLGASRYIRASKTYLI